MNVDDVIWTPWHYVILDDNIGDRMRLNNPAVWQVYVLDHQESWTGGLQALVDQGATDAEIWQGGWTNLLPIPLRRLL